jgi:hypothetical protein
MEYQRSGYKISGALDNKKIEANKIRYSAYNELGRAIKRVSKEKTEYVKRPGLKIL